MRHYLFVITFVALTSCSEKLENQVTALVDGKNRWIGSTKKNSYSFVYRHNCFCFLDDTEIFIEVENGKIISATVWGGEHTPISPETFSTIEQMFDFILEGIRKQEQENSIAIDVVYNKTLGYPEKIIYERLNVTDGFATIYISDLVIDE